VSDTLFVELVEPFPADLIDAAIRLGERGVQADPRYPEPGTDRAGFWRQVTTASLAISGPLRPLTEAERRIRDEPA
jgi:hypothetical protein